MNDTQLDPITPGEVLREDFMEPMGLSINKLARMLSVPPPTESAKFLAESTDRI